MDTALTSCAPTCRVHGASVCSRSPMPSAGKCCEPRMPCSPICWARHRPGSSCRNSCCRSTWMLRLATKLIGSSCGRLPGSTSLELARNWSSMKQRGASIAADPDGVWPRRRRRLAGMVITIALLGVSTAPWATTAAEKTTAIVGATVLHPELEGAAVVAPDSTIVIKDNRIIVVGPAGHTRVPRGATVIDGHGKWVIPGLIDSHVHFFQSGDLYTRPDVVDLNSLVPYSEELRRNRARLAQTFRVWLASGVTSVADVGGPFWNFEVREAARASLVAPRVTTTGPLISMVPRPQLDLGDPPIIKISSPEEARALVARELPHKPDYIKVWFIHEPGDDLGAQESIVRATADAAHSAGLRLAVHATELVVAKAALRAGADFLVHSVQDEPVDDEFIALARARHILYCPTLFVIMGYRYALSGTWQPTEAEKRLADPQVLAGLRLEAVPPDQLPERV